MIGLHAIAAVPSSDGDEGTGYQKVKLLDGELDHADWYTSEECLEGLKLSDDPSLWDPKREPEDNPPFRVPAKFAIAHQLISSFVSSTQSLKLHSDSNTNSSNETNNTDQVSGKPPS
jgi:hypothetical protein